MKDYTQQELDDLLRCPKTISDPPRKQMVEERGSKRNDMKLTSEDGNARFHVFMRICVDFPENFSIGLNYCPDDGSGIICLIRCNGAHQGLDDSERERPQHFGYHIHRVLADNVELGLKPEKGAEQTKEFGSYREALRFFLKECNVRDAQKYFAEELKDTLFDGIE